METIDAVRMFCDGRMSLHDVRSLVVSMGHTAESFVAAVNQLSSEEGSSIRVGSFQRGEYQAELYLTVGSHV